MEVEHYLGGGGGNLVLRPEKASALSRVVMALGGRFGQRRQFNAHWPGNWSPGGPIKQLSIFQIDYLSRAVVVFELRKAPRATALETARTSQFDRTSLGSTGARTREKIKYKRPMTK